MPTCASCEQKTVFISMAEDGRPSGDRSGVRFRDVLQTTWNVPESFVTLTSPEVVMLDTLVILDVLGLRTHSGDAGWTLLPGRAPNSVRVIIPADRATARRFHDVTLVDMSIETSPIVSMEEMGTLRRQWPTSLLMAMTRWQTELESMRRECEAKFRSSQTGVCTHRGTNIRHDMARHVSNYCGGAQSRGALSRKGPPRIVLTTFAHGIMWGSR